jgi:hypothetical protein
MVYTLATCVFSQCILDRVSAFVEASEVEGPKVNSPDPVVDFFKGNELFREDVTDIDPVAVPSNAAVMTDAADFEVLGILERGEASGERAG